MNYNLRKTIMRIIFSLLIIALSIPFLYAEPVYGQALKENNITCTVKGAAIADVFSELNKQTGFHFFYEESVIADANMVTIQIKNGSMDSILRELTRQTGLQFKRIDQTISVSKNSPEAVVESPGIAQARRQISGTVTDELGEPVIGANVVEKGTMNGTVTDTDGRFTLSTDPNALLVISYIGYTAQEIEVGNQNTIRISLSEDTQSLEEVVVVGYGVVKKSDLTGSVSSVKSSELTAIPSSTVLQVLQGRSSGLQVKQNSGSPGGAVSVRIRGTNSIQGSNEPLYVIDGFPSSSTNPTILDNHDIESIEILKDASAVAIYGSRGANGVVMITTKRGKSGKTKVDFTTTLGFQSIRKKLDMMNAKEYAQFYNLQHKNDGLDPYFSESEINSFGEGFDWQDFVFRTAPIRTHSFIVSGGSEKTQFSLSGNIFDQDGILTNSGYKRYSVKANITQQISKQFALNYSSTLSRSILNNKNWGGARFGASLISSALCSPPTLTPYKDDGSYTEINHSYPFMSEGSLNPLNYINEREDVTKSNQILGSVSLTYKPIEELTIKVYGGVENSDNRSDYYTTLKYINSQGSASVSTSQYTSFLNENTINYAKVFADKHSVSALVGFTYQDFISTGLSGSGTGFLSDVTKTGSLSSASIPGIPSSYYSKSVLLSYLARVNYSFNNRYLFTASFRADGSSKYSDGNKWGYFPSGAVAWKMKEEAFLKDVDVLSDLKLRGSYGITGSQAIGAYATLNNLGAGRTIFGNAQYLTFSPGTRLPGDLKWETTKQVDIGVDVGIMNNRFQFTVDYYIKDTKDLLNTVQLPSSSGYLTTVQNIGRIQNKGFEFTADANVLTGEFFWKLNGNISFNKTIVKKLYDGQDILGGWVDMIIITDNFNLLREGEPMSVFYGYLKDGYDDNGTEIYKDLNPDGVINQEDKVIIGDPNPDFIYGLNSFMSWKDFELSMFFQGSQGNDMANVSVVDNSLDYGYGCNMLKEVLNNNWTPENPNTKYPRVTRSQTMRFSDRLIEDGSYFRLKNIELAYNLPVKKWNVNWLEKIRIYASAQNLLTFTSYSGWDPDVNSQGGENSFAQGIDHYSYPTAKSFTFGINIGF